MSNVTALVRDNFDSISEVKYVTHCYISTAQTYSLFRAAFWLCRVKNDEMESNQQKKRKNLKGRLKVLTI